MVPFASRILPGIVAGIDQVPPNIPTRDLLGPVVDAPRIDPARVETALWMASYYHCSPFDALCLFLPPGWQRAIRERPGSESSPAGWEYQWPRPPLSERSVVGIAEGVSEQIEATGVRARVISFLTVAGPATAATVMGETGVALVTLKRMVKEGSQGVGALLPLPDAGRGRKG